MEGHEAPIDLHHYLCYRVMHEKPIGAEVELNDQFLEESAKVGVGVPRLFGVPVAKGHSREGELKQPGDEVEHLAVYRIGDIDAEAKTSITDQFHEEKQVLETVGAFLLCVPSLKHDWHEEQNEER